MDETFDLSEVSEIVRNDPDGHRLTEYLKKKSGRVIPRRIYDYEENRLTIDVSLRRVSEGGEGENINENNEDEPIQSTPPMEKNGNVDPLVREHSPFRISGRSPLASYIKRTSHATDDLRQSALKRLTRKTSGRCLSNAFNNISQSLAGVEFSPHIASTPMNNIPGISNAENNTKATPTKPTSEVRQQTPLNDAIDNENNDSIPSTGTARQKEPEKSKKQTTCKGIQQEEICMESYIEQNQRTPPRMGNKSGLTVQIMQNSPQPPNIAINTDDITTDDEEEVGTRKARKIHVMESSDDSDTNEENNTPNIVACSKRSQPLNKAPRTPINGEKFADELKKQMAGLSNRRVLDLRKRKSGSLGKNKPLSLSKKKESAAKEPNQPTASSTKSMAEQNDRQCSQKRKDSQSPLLAPVDTGQLEMEVFEDESSGDRVSFLPRVQTTTSANPTKPKEKEVKKPVTSEVCESYIEAKEKLSGSKKKINESKRSIYSLGNGSNIQMAPSTSVCDIVPPPLKFQSSTPRRQMRSSTARKHPSLTQTPLSPVNSRSPSPLPSSSLSIPPASAPSPPPSASSPPHSAPSQSPAESISSIKKNKNEKRKKKQKEKEKFESKKSKKNDEEVFKKPKGRAPKKKTKLQPIEAATSRVCVPPPRNESSSNPSPPVDVQPSADESSPSPSPPVDVQPCADEPTLRRSTRVRKEMPKPLFWIMWEKSLIKSIDDAEKRRLKKESKLASNGSSNNTENDMMPIASSQDKSARGRKRKKTQRKALEEIPENEPILTVQQPTETMDNDINEDDHTTENANEEPQAQPSGTNLSEWLKELNCEPEATCSSSGNTFKNMNVATRDELYFSSFASMEYAFYNSNEKSSGYMRFQPRQTKPTSRIIQVLNFVIISGEFNITTDGETVCVTTGDLITINKGSRYSIESIIDEIGVILFIKV